MTNNFTCGKIIADFQVQVQVQLRGMGNKSNHANILTNYNNCIKTPCSIFRLMKSILHRSIIYILLCTSPYIGVDNTLTQTWHTEIQCAPLLTQMKFSSKKIVHILLWIKFLVKKLKIFFILFYELHQALFISWIFFLKSHRNLLSDMDFFSFYPAQSAAICRAACHQHQHCEVVGWSLTIFISTKIQLGNK